MTEGGRGNDADAEARRALEQQLRETESRFRNMADAAPVLLWMARADGMCTFFNQTWLEFTGRNLEQEWGVGWAEGVHFEDLQHCLDTYTDAFNARSVFEMEYRLRRGDGEFRWVLDRGTPRYTPDGGFAGYIGSCVDITERKQLETELREAVKVRDEFLSIASHELRTPLTSLKLRAERLHELAQRAAAAGGGGDPRLARDATVMLNQVVRLATMVDVLLDVSRIAEGPLTLDREVLEVAPFLAGIVERMQEAAAAARSPIGVELRAPAGLRAHWDRFRVEQVVTNLLANAMKYGAGCPIAVVLEHEAGRARIAVRDQGPGIAAEHQQRLFERFARFAPTRHYSGFGLGLWIARAIVEAHGGTVSVESVPGQGAAFIVEMPLSVPEGEGDDNGDDGEAV